VHDGTQHDSAVVLAHRCQRLQQVHAQDGAVDRALVVGGVDRVGVPGGLRAGGADHVDEQVSQDHRQPRGHRRALVTADDHHFGTPHHSLHAGTSTTARRRHRPADPPVRALLGTRRRPAHRRLRVGRPAVRARAGGRDARCRGLTQKEIGARLYISPKTLEQHVARLRRKLAATNRAGLVAALRAHLPVLTRGLSARPGTPRRRSAASAARTRTAPRGRPRSAAAAPQVARATARSASVHARRARPG
jgi:hypothetical protein